MAIAVAMGIVTNAAISDDKTTAIVVPPISSSGQGPGASRRRSATMASPSISIWNTKRQNAISKGPIMPVRLLDMASLIGTSSTAAIMNGMPLIESASWPGACDLGTVMR